MGQNGHDSGLARNVQYAYSMKPNGAAGWILLIGIITVGFSGYFNLVHGPAKSEAQRWFRISLFPTGLVLVGIAYVLRKRGSRFFVEE